MKIEKDKVVALAYELEVDGKIADKATEEKPLEYIHGSRMLLPRFEEELLGKEPGGDFAFTLSPEEGYGVSDERLKVDLPRKVFEIDGEIHEEILRVGRVLPMLDSNGQVVQGTILEMRGDIVSMDFNHPMAGKTLHFTGKVVSVRDAAPKELEEGLHGEYRECCHGRHGEGHGEGECCHGRHGEGHGEGECCHGKGDCHRE